MRYTVFTVCTLDNKFIRAGRYCTDSPCSKVSAMKSNPTLCYVDEVAIHFTVAEADLHVQEIREQYRKPPKIVSPAVKVVHTTPTERVRRAKVTFA